ncbi:MAG TPA: MraY family glycosyltransferase [Luteibaculaceae bacterium]|nr:MraY family glycosyltransferase [Luteibaculaceae bacterium]
MISGLLGFLFSFITGLIIIPIIIKVAKIKHLVDEPSEDRKVHRRSIPTVGGIGIFAAFLFSSALWAGWEEGISIAEYRFFQYFVASLLILFFTGLKDDLTGMSPFKKLLALLFVGLIMVYLAPMRIITMHGIFGVTHLPDWAAIVLSLFTYIVVVNAINLIDGIDGLAGGVGAIAGLGFGLWFLLAGNSFFALLGFALAGSLFGFLVYNWSPAKIFMGDSGSLLVGFILCVLAIKLISYQDHQVPELLAKIPQPVFAMTMLSYPLLDTIRVFIIRSISGKSPLSADRNHIHHRLIGNHFTHRRASVIVYLFVVALVFLMFLLPGGNSTLSFLAMLLAGVLGTAVVIRLKPLRRR